MRTVSRPLRFCVSAVALLAAVELRAAPPELRYLLPSGVERGTTATVSVGRSLNPNTTKAWSSRHDVRVRVVGGDRPLEVTATPGAAPGICWIRLYNAEGASAARPFVIGSAPEINEAEPNDRRKQAQRVNSTVVVNGALSRTEDVDTFAVKLKAGQTIVASLLAHRLLGSPMDGVLQIVSDEGFVLAQNDDEHDLDPQIDFVAPADGEYLVRVFSFPAEPGQAIRFHQSSDSVYRLTLCTGPFAEYPWPLAVTAGNRRRVELRGWNLGSRASRLVDAVRGVEEVSLDNATAAIATQVRVLDHATFCEPSSGKSASAGRRLEIPVAISGVISKPNEIDEYVFPVTAGQNVELQVESRALGFPLDPVIEVKPPGGAVIEADDSAGGLDVSLSLRVDKPGDLHVCVTDRFGHGGTRFVYLLTARLTEPQLHLSVSSDTFILPRSKPLVIDVAVARSGGLSDPLTITAVDLPTGVRATPATSAGEGPTSKSVQIVLEGAGPILQPGAFRIVAIRPGELPAVWLARAAAAKNQSTMTQFWLTVPEPSSSPARAKQLAATPNRGKPKR